MSILDKIKGIFIKQVDDKLEEEKQEEYEVLLNDIDRCALYLKNREKPFVFIKDKNFPFMLNNPDLEFIEMNKDNFEYYGEFYRFELMTEKILKLEKQEEIEKKTENDYLVDYLEHSNSDYSKIIEKMKTFEIDKQQYDKLLNNIRKQISETVNSLYNNYENSNINLETNRSYKEIMDNLMDMKSFTDKYPYKYYREIRYAEGIVSHCGYPDYMWQSGAERNIYTFSKDS